MWDGERRLTQIGGSARDLVSSEVDSRERSGLRCQSRGLLWPLKQLGSGCSQVLLRGSLQVMTTRLESQPLHAQRCSRHGYAGRHGLHGLDACAGAVPERDDEAPCAR